MLSPKHSLSPIHTASLSGCLWLCGSTAVGKSEVALLLAERIGGEIISVDSMQVYRGMNIGTAKASSADCARVPHHLIDVVEPAECFDAAQFRRLAQAAEGNIRARGRVPIFCGGTGLYFKALIDGLGDVPATNASLRDEIQKAPLSELLEELAECDPETFARIDHNNPRRVARAVEVFRLTGRPFSDQRAEWNPPTGKAEPRPTLIGLRRGADDLRRRIDDRVEQMFRLGLVAETKQLLPRGLDQNPTAAQALGYRQVIEHLKGVRGLAETVELVKIRTRQFAKRQRTWFSRQLQVEWLELGEGQDSQAVSERLAARWFETNGS